MEKYLRSLFIATCGRMDEDVYLSAVKGHYGDFKRDHDMIMNAMALLKAPEPPISLYSLESVAERLARKIESSGILSNEDMDVVKYVVSKYKGGGYEELERFVKVCIAHNTSSWKSQNEASEYIFQQVCAEMSDFALQLKKNASKLEDGIHYSDLVTNVFEYIILGRRANGKYEWESPVFEVLSDIRTWAARFNVFLQDEPNDDEREILFKEMYLDYFHHGENKTQHRDDLEKKIDQYKRNFYSIFDDDFERRLIGEKLDEALKGDLLHQLPPLIYAITEEMPKIWGRVMSRRYYPDWAYRKELVLPSLDLRETFNGLQYIGTVNEGKDEAEIKEVKKRLFAFLDGIKAEMLEYERDTKPIFEVDKVRMAENDKRKNENDEFRSKMYKIKLARDTFETYAKQIFSWAKRRGEWAEKEDERAFRKQSMREKQLHEMDHQLIIEGENPPKLVLDL